MINRGLLTHANPEFSYEGLCKEKHSQPVMFCSQPERQEILDGSDLSTKPKDRLPGKQSPSKNNNDSSRLLTNYHVLGIIKGTLYTSSPFIL